MRPEATHSHRRPYRWVATVTTIVLTAGLMVAVDQQGSAATGGPSVDLPETASTPVSAQSLAGRPADGASSDALSGNQVSGGGAAAGGGTPTATPLSPSATWDVSTHTGDFQWSYPLRVPPVPGGLVPNLALGYRSSVVDGRTSATNNQPSWIGDGWDLNPGFVERSYGSCASDDGGGTEPPDNGDLCWRSDNATAVYGGGGGMLIRDVASGQWRPKHDDGARVERLTGGDNTDDNGEYWKITTVDGTQYFFGSRSAATSTWTVPVYGDDAGEPCHAATFTGSRCRQAWRWNLDKIVDARGNMILFSYRAESNSFGSNMEEAAVSYIRGGTLRRIDYGLHARAPGEPAARVLFDVANRCVPGSTCTFERPENWPDTPLTERCVAATCPDKHFPTFWSTQRLESVTTQVRRGGEWDDVDRWSLEQEYPEPGDGESGAALWLKSITHTGLVGDEKELPPVTFEGTAMANRVYQEDMLSPLLRYRITGIVSESGGVISVDYAEPNCVPGESMPDNAHTNSLRCFPVTWNRPGHAERTDWFHKYVVETVNLSDRMSSSMDQRISYEYLDGAAWHYDTSEFTPEEKRTWNEFRGYGRVRVRQGRSPDPAGPITMSEQRFYRGMHGDRLPGGRTRSVAVTDGEGVRHTDHDWLQGFELESTTYLGDSSTVVSRTIKEPHWQGPTAKRDEFKAYIVRTASERTFTSLADGGRRITKVATAYDDHGLATTVNDLGDEETSADDVCTRTTYVRNTSAWLLSKPARVQTVSSRCGATPEFPEHAVSDQLYSYDGQEHGEAPLAGNVTRVDVLDEYEGSSPVYVVESTSKHDVHGRVIETTDALDRTTTTAYTPRQGGPVTQTVTTNPLGHTTTTVLEPASGQPLTVTDTNGRVTETAYDPLGRAVSVWLPDRQRLWGFDPNYRFSYDIRREAPTVITTTKLGPNDTYTSTNELYDGLLRLRQVQSPAVGGGRLLVDTRYDSQGRAYQTTHPYYNDQPVDTSLWVAADVDVPGSTRIEYDGAGRKTASVLMDGAEEQWRSTTAYEGDRVHVTPPAGGTATTTVTDARGRPVELRQYHGPTPEGEHDTTTYSYTPAGQLATVTDPAGNEWTYSYDLQGHRVRSDDPDTGIVTSSFDASGQLISRTDARDQTVAFEYDELGRMLTARAGSTAGRMLAEWTYDTVENAVGKPASATSYDEDGHAYRSEILTYTARYQPRKTSVTIPASEGDLAGTYVSSISYKPDGSVAGESYPQVGGMFAEEVFHTYDDFGRPLTTYGGPDGETVEYASGTEYTTYGQLQRLQLGSGTRRAWLSHYYDEATRRIERTIVDAEVARPMQADLNYTYDPAGNVTSIADTPAEQPADVQCFRYDHLRRLTEAWTPGSGCAEDPSVGDLAGPAPFWQSFTYDAVGNRISRVDHAATGDTVRAHTYPEPGNAQPHALASLATTGPTGETTEAYEYDAAGNAVRRGGQQLTWDVQGMLTSVTENGQVTEYVYDAAGQRLIRRDPQGTTLYLGNQEIRLDDATGTASATRYYSHGGGTIAVRTSSGLSWLFKDHHGTAQVAIDATTLTTSVRRSDPFGNPRGAEPSRWPDDKGFLGGTQDESTGLTNLGAREYDPMLGRFISVDSLIDSSDPQQMNGYAYAGNNPVTMADPDGKFYYVDVEGHITAPRAAGWTPKAQRRVREQVQRWSSYYGQQAAVRKATFDAAGYSEAEYREAIKLKQKSLFDVVIEAGGDVLNEFLGINDIKGCFGGGNLGSCISMVLNIIPWTKLHRLGELVGAVRRAWNSVSAFRGLQKWADNVVGAVKAARDRVRARASCHSFAPGTAVLMADGSYKPIDEIELGDEVVATDPETGETKVRKVVALHTNLDRELADVTVQDTDGDESTDTLRTTGNHPFWSETDDAWVDAGELAAGDLLLTSGGRRIEVADVREYTGQRTMYDLTVEGTHTYFVAVDGTEALVHNNDFACSHGKSYDESCKACGRVRLPANNPKGNAGTSSERQPDMTYQTGQDAGADGFAEVLKDTHKAMNGEANDLSSFGLGAATIAWAIAKAFKKSRG